MLGSDVPPPKWKASAGCEPTPSCPMTAAAEDHPGRRSRATKIMLPGAWPFHDPLEDVEKICHIAETS